MQKEIGSKKTLAHSRGRREDRLNEGVSSEVDSRYTEAFKSYEDHDETSSGLSYELDELVFESSSSTYSSATESDGSCSDDDTSVTRSKCSAFSSTSNSSSDFVVRRRGKYSGLSHFEQYCKKRQRRAMTDGTIDKIMKNNQVGSSTERKTCEDVAASSFHEQYLKKEVNRSSPAVIVKGLKAPKKLGFLTSDGPKVKAPSCVVVTKYTDDISILSEPATAIPRKKVTKRPSSNLTKPHDPRHLTKPHDPRHLEDKDQSSHHEYRKNIKPARESDDDGMSSSTPYTGLDRSGILDDRVHEEHPVHRSDIFYDSRLHEKHPVHHLNRNCVHSSDDEMDKQSNSSVTFSLNRNKNAYSQQIHTNNTGDQHEIKGFSSKDFQKSAQKIIKLHSPSNKFLQSNFRKFAKSSILKLRGRKGVHIGRTMDEHEQADDEAKVVDDLEINEDGPIKNKKIVYHKFGGNPEIEMKLLEIHENLVPASNSSKVLVRVEASTVSMMDSKIRRSLVQLPFLGDDEITPGIDVVGIVQKCGDEATTLYGINQNDMVASLVGIGGNATFICLDASKVVRVPSGISDTSAAAVVIETYLPAFQALVYGLQSDQRYSSSFLQGRNVLITGGISNLGQALIQLALYFGAAKVYTTAISKHHALLTSLGAIPVDASLDTIWCDHIDCHIDIAISNHSLANIHDVMNYGGKIVFLGEGGTAGLAGLFGSISDFILLRIRGLSTFTYDMFYEWDNDMETSKKDLSYLFGLLRLNRITPQVTRTVGLKNVPKAHVYLESKKRVQGTMVCFPSKR